MTVLSALKASVNYPLSESNVEPLLITRGLTPSATFDQSIGTSKEYRLAYADTLRFVVTMVNLQQGGSVTMPNASVLAGTANAIYREYGEPLIGEKGDTLSTLKDGSDEW
jgi:hypothetical protein